MQQKIAPTEAVVSNFIIAIRSGSVEQVKKYLDMYTNDLVNKLDVQSRQPSLYFSVLIADHQKSYEIMKMLIQHGANPNFKDQYIQTSLFYACRDGKDKCVDLLLQQGIAVDQQDIYGQTPLYYIARENRMNLLQKFIDRVNVNHVDKISNQTALFYSARQGHLEMCKALIDHGCDVTHQDSSHKTAAFYAKKFGKNEVYDYLANELQKVKEQKKVAMVVQVESKSKDQEKKTKKKAKVPEATSNKYKVQYRIVRTDEKGQTVEFTEAEYLDWVKDYPEIQNLLLSPDNIDPDVIEEAKNAETWEKAAGRVINHCWKYKGAYVFYEPVDPKKYNISDYFDIVKHPMDFGTIKKKLAHNVYNDSREFVQDMMLVFSNCILYNGNQSDIGKVGIELRKQFQQSARMNGLLTE